MTPEATAAKIRRTAKRNGFVAKSATGVFDIRGGRLYGRPREEHERHWWIYSGPDLLTYDGGMADDEVLEWLSE
jgi:hypothetical protein